MGYENRYSLNQVFANNKIFEDAVIKHNLTPSENIRIKLITDSWFWYLMMTDLHGMARNATK